MVTSPPGLSQILATDSLNTSGIVFQRSPDVRMVGVGGGVWGLGGWGGGGGWGNDLSLGTQSSIGQQLVNNSASNVSVHMYL